MADNDKNTFKEKKQERQQKRVDKLTEERKSEAEKYGVDIGPLGPERKAKIDKSMQEGVKDYMLSGLNKIQSTRQAPDVNIQTKPSTNATIKDVRKERRAKVADILGSLGSGLRGEKVDPTMFRDKLKDERLSQYQQYRDSAQASKKRLEEWQSGYIDEQLDYLNQKLDDPKTSELEKVQINKAKAQLDNERARLGITKEKLRQLKESYGKKDKDKEATAKRVIKLGDDETLTTEIPLSEVEERERQAKIKEATSRIDMELEQSKLELADMGEEGTKKREVFDRPKRNNLIAKIKSLEEQRGNIINEIGGETPTAKPQTEPKPEAEVQGASDFDSIINKYK